MIAVLCTLIFYGCSSSGSPGDKSSLTGTEWVMFEMKGIKYEPPGDEKVTITFDGTEKRIQGKAPCNTYGSTYEKSGNKLSIGSVFSTEMACDNLKTETDYYKLLTEVVSHRISGDKLYLFDSTNTIILRFRAK